MAKTFFLIDDDRDDRELFSEALAAVDPSVVCLHAGDGEEALNKLDSMATDVPDIIFLDINLPAMTGWQCLDRLKSGEASKKIPVIMYSTSSHLRDKNIARNMGALCLITKPNDYKEIKSVLATVVTNINTGQVANICGDLESLQG